MRRPGRRADPGHAGGARVTTGRDRQTGAKRHGLEATMRNSLRAGVASLVLTLPLIQPLVVSPALAQTQPNAARPVAEQSAPWPHLIQGEQGSVTVYQPQAISWEDRATLTARVAVAVTPTGAKDPILGTLEITVTTAVDPAAGIVALSDPKLVSSRFPMLDTTQAAQIEGRVRAALPTMTRKTVQLETVLLSLKQTQQARPVAVNNDPPAIFYRARPASLVVFDGEPVLAPIGTTGLSFAVNTNWPVFSDGKAWYLLVGALWLTAPAAIGPWQSTDRLPPAFAGLPADQNFAEVKKAIPPKPQKPPVPEIIVSTKPAEIIVTEGAPQFVPVPGTSLQAVRNASSALFLDPAKGDFYYLTSGRWFSAGGLDGPWSFATDRLPPDFAMIDPEGNYGAVLPSVPNTAQAQASVLKAQLPQQGTLKRDTATVAVSYVGGAPAFAPIPGTPIKYATNSPFQVLEVNGRFYVCHQGAWFVSATSAGPWVLAESVPQVVYTIPPSSPMYPVTYVTVQSYNPASVTYAYTAGYMMGFITAGVLVYGTGYYYPPYVYPGRLPVYMPYPYSYAGGVYYNNGAWARGGAVYGPYYGAKGGAYYNASTGAYARGGAVYGPYGGAGAWSAYNPSTGSYARGSASWNAYGGTMNASAYNAQTGRAATTTQNTNMYQRWGSSTISTPTQTVNTASASGPRGSAGAFQSTSGAQGAGVNTARGGTAAVQTKSGDVYAGHDGNVYKHTDSGWQSYDKGTWQSVQKPTSASGTTGAAQRQPQTTRTAPTTTQQPAVRTAPTQQPTRQAPTMSQSSFQQLEQDRQARMAGRAGAEGRSFQGRAAEGRGFEGRGFEGRGFEGRGFEGRGFEGGRLHR